MNRTDWLLLAIDLAPRRVQPVQLQKTLFLLDRKLSPAQKGMESIYNFTPYDYGPFDSAVYQDAEALEMAGFLAITRPPISSYKQYGVTEEGHRRALAAAAQLPPEGLAYVKAVIEWVHRLSFNQLVAAVYREFPDMKINSVFKPR